MKKLLVLGGTQFIGRNLIEALLKINEYDITIFNRGNTNATLFPNVKRIKGDRNTDDIFKIGEEQWDFVIDVSCYYPNSLENLLKALNKNVKRFVFVSTCSVYQNPKVPTLNRDEAAPILNCTEAEKTNASTASYGQRKAECERVLEKSGLDYISLRPALVYGKYDHTDRLYYWMYQTQHKPVLLVPDNGQRLFSLTYVHDLVAWIIKALSIQNHNQVYNAISHPQSSIGKIIQTTQKLELKEPQLINATPEFLHQNNIAQWSEMPLWIDNDNMTFDNQKILNDFKIPVIDFETSIKETIKHYATTEFLNVVPQYGMNELKRLTILKSLLR